MNVKKIILAATTLIMATTLPNSFADSNQVTGIQTEKVYVSEYDTNAIKFNLRDKNYTVVGLYLGKDEYLGTWTGSNCKASNSSQLTCTFKSSHGREGTISFVAKDDSLRSTLKYNHLDNETKEETHNWQLPAA